MIFKSFLFSSLSFSMRIINSVVVVGLYYGFLTTFSIGPSQIFFLQSWIREEGDIRDYWRFHYGAAHDLHIDLLSTSVSILSQLNRWKIYPIWLYYIMYSKNGSEFDRNARSSQVSLFTIPKRWNSDFRTISYKRMVSITLRNGFLYQTIAIALKKKRN